MIDQLLLSVSFDDVEEAIGIAARQGLGIEITLYDTDWLMGETALDDASRLRDSLDSEGLLVTTHGPLYDLNPGSLDPTIRSYTAECFKRGVEVSAALGAGKVVYHTFFNPLLPEDVLIGWKELSAPVWKETQRRAAELGVVVCLENSYEPTAEFFKGLFEVFSHGSLSMCYDPAHVHLYSRDGQSAWVVTLGHRVTHLHLNDNHGSSDDHLALGQGNMSYGSFLLDLCKVCKEATVVLEMDVERALSSLSYLRDIGVWYQR